MARLLSIPIHRFISRSLSLTPSITSSASHSASASRSLVSSFSPSFIFHRGSPRLMSSTSEVSPLDVPTPSSSLFFLCDIQETFRDKFHNWPAIVATSAILTRVSALLEIPILVTEQKPFKPTIAELDYQVNKQNLVFQKSLFSMLTPEVHSSLLENSQFAGRKQIILFGIESHVCVMQTALDLLRCGFHVRIVLDAISSGNSVDSEIAIQRFRSLASQKLPSGVLTLTSAESIIFELIRDAAQPQFKSIIPLIKELGKFKKSQQIPSPAAKM